MKIKEDRYDLFLEILSVGGLKHNFTKEKVWVALKETADLERLEYMSIILYYFQNLPYSKVGEEIHKSSQRVSQIIRKAVFKLRHPSRMRRFINYLISL